MALCKLGISEIPLPLISIPPFESESHEMLNNDKSQGSMQLLVYKLQGKLKIISNSVTFLPPLENRRPVVNLSHDVRKT
jgi:hypothetical protein